MAKEKGKDVKIEKKTLTEAQQKSIDLALKQLDKSFGKGSIIKVGDAPIEDINVISTGSIGLDVALGVGGIPEGRVIEIYGPESSGKTTLTLHMIAEAQKLGGVCAFIDVENAIDFRYAQAIGVDTANLYFSQPQCAEEALDIVETLVRTNAFSLIVVDSVAALVPRVELEGEMSDQQMGVQARLMAKALRKLIGILNKSGTTLVFINQLRDKIGGMSYGSNDVTTGGKSLKFYASVRLDIRRIATLKNGESQIGNRVKVKVAKNKVAPPFAVTEFDIIFGEGISKMGEIVDYGVKFDIIDKSGAWFSYNESKLGQGKENSKKFLMENPDIAAEIENKIAGQLVGSLPLEIEDTESEDE
jgi:recombination protein RecA